MAESKSLIDCLLEAQEGAKKRRCIEVENLLYTSIKSDPFIKETTVNTNSREEADYIKNFLEKKGLKVKLTSRLEISKKVTSIDLIVTIPQSASVESKDE